MIGVFPYLQTEQRQKQKVSAEKTGEKDLFDSGECFDLTSNNVFQRKWEILLNYTLAINESFC
jgi:hypothetical protein